MNRKMRFFAILLCFITAMTLCTFPVTVSAEEAGAETAEFVETDTAVSDNPDNPADSITGMPDSGTEAPASEIPETSQENVENASTYNTVFTRIWEFVTTYSGETLSVVGSAILLILNLILKHTSSKTSKDTKTTLEAIKNEVGETLGGQNSVVSVVNNMIDSYNSLSQNYSAMKESYDRYGAMEGERNRVVGAALATNAAILEILTTVYVNSKNLPQGVKDLVNLKYANCLKTLEDDEQLRAVVEAVRDNIGTAKSTGIKTEDMGDNL